MTFNEDNDDQYVDSASDNNNCIHLTDNILYIIYKLAGLGATKIYSLADNVFAKSYAKYENLRTTTFEDFRPKKEN